MFDSPPLQALSGSTEQCSRRHSVRWAALAQRYTVLSKQVCRSQERAALALLCGEVCTAIDSTGWSSHYLSALLESSQCLPNFPILPAPPTGDVWHVPVGDISQRKGQQHRQGTLDPGVIQINQGDAAGIWKWKKMLLRLQNCLCCRGSAPSRALASMQDLTGCLVGVLGSPGNAAIAFVVTQIWGAGCQKGKGRRWGHSPIILPYQPWSWASTWGNSVECDCSPPMERGCMPWDCSWVVLLSCQKFRNFPPYITMKQVF